MAQVSIQADKTFATRFGEAADYRRAKTPFAHSRDEPNRIPELVQFSDNRIRSITAVIIDKNYLIRPFGLRHCIADSNHKGAQIFDFAISRDDNGYAAFFRRIRSFTHRIVLKSRRFLLSGLDLA